MYHAATGILLPEIIQCHAAIPEHRENVFNMLCIFQGLVIHVSIGIDLDNVFIVQQYHMVTVKITLRKQNGGIVRHFLCHRIGLTLPYDLQLLLRGFVPE